MKLNLTPAEENLITEIAVKEAKKVWADNKSEINKKITELKKEGDKITGNFEKVENELLEKSVQIEKDISNVKEDLKKIGNKIKIEIDKVEKETISELKTNINESKERILKNLNWMIVPIIAIVVAIVFGTSLFTLREESNKVHEQVKTINSQVIEMQKSSIGLYDKLDNFNSRVLESDKILKEEQEKIEEKVADLDNIIKKYNEQLGQITELKEKYEDELDKLKNAR